MWWSCVLAAAGKGEPIPLDKEKENGEDNGQIKAMDVESSKVEIAAAEETKEMTAETITEKSEDEKPVSTEPSVKDAADELNVENVSEGNGAVEKPTEEDEIPPPQGIHALVGEVPKLHEVVEAAQEPEAIL